jgi:hypothetical protein
MQMANAGAPATPAAASPSKVRRRGGWVGRRAAMARCGAESLCLRNAMGVWLRFSD